jgi:DNA-binding Lrp family transcriptional regulator
LAKLLGVARATVQTRMDRLIASGIIAGFAVRLKETQRPFGYAAS